MKKFFVILSACLCLLCIYNVNRDVYHSNQIDTENQKIIQETKDINEVWYRFKERNPDFIAYLQFDTGLISLPIVQSADNTYYLHTSFDGIGNSMGCPFMDDEDSMDDQGILIYGHYVYADETKMFSPLTQLIKQKTYEENAFFSLLFENERRRYQIICIIRVCIDEPHVSQRKSSFQSEEDFNDWYSQWNEKNEINSIESMIASDHFVILQTCIRNKERERLLILAKQIT